MTNGAIKMNEHRENVRNNQERNAETRRSNLAKEQETKRSNKAKERQAYADHKQRDRQKKADVVMWGGNKVTDIGTAVIKALGNDPSFYTKGQEDLVNRVVPTNVLTPMGNAIKFDGAVTKDQWTNTAKTGIVAHYYVNSVGYALSATDPLNKAANVLFTNIQRNTNYSKDYQSADVMLMLLQQRECVTLAHHIAKVFRLAQSNPVLNRYTPRDLVNANCVEYSDLITNMSDYKIRFRMILNAAKHLSVVDIPLLYRAAQLAGSTYWDEDDEAQSAIHTFVPVYSGKLAYNEDDITIREKIEYTELFDYEEENIKPNNLLRMEVWLDRLEESVNILLADSVFKFIVGDLERTFNKFWDLSDIAIDMGQEHSHDPYMLNQISNIRYASPTTGSLTVDQDPNAGGFLICRPLAMMDGVDHISTDFKANTNAFASYVDLHDGLEPTANNVLDVTRLQPVLECTSVTDKGMANWRIHCGTEIPVASRYYYYETNNSDLPSQLRVTARTLTGGSLTDPFYNAVYILRAVNSINHYPVHNLYEVSASTKYVKLPVLRIANLERVRTYDNNAFKYMNELSLYSLLGITSLY